MLKYARIAVSALCLFACCALLAFWVRSYRYDDELRLRASERSSAISSRLGTIVLSTTHYRILPGVAHKTSAERIHGGDQTVGGRLGFYTTSLPRIGFYFVQAPHWFFILLAGSLGAMSWPRRTWRFRLRTMLIATTLVAIFCGVIAIAAR